MQPQPALECPVCGGPNDCAAARQGTFAVSCWCVQVTVSEAALARIPADRRNRACLCRRCAEVRPRDDT